MTVIANTLYGDNGLICYPAAISGTVYFVDKNTATNAFVIRSYNPASGLNNDVVGTIPGYSALTRIYGMNEANKTASLCFICSITSGNIICTYDASTGSKAAAFLPVYSGSQNPPFPYMCSVSGDTRYVFFAEYLNPSTNVQGGVSIWDRTGTTFTQILTFTSGWEPTDMVLANDYTAGKTGRLYVMSDSPNTSSTVRMYTLPASAPYDTGTWTDVTPSLITTSYVNSSSATYSHGGLANITTRTVADDAYVKYSYLPAATGWTGRYGHTMSRVSGYLVVMAGNTDATTTSGTNEVWKSTDGSAWGQAPPPAWDARFYQITGFTDDYNIILMGGEGGTASGRNDVWKSSDCSSWACMTSNAEWSARCNFGGAVRGQRVIVVGGRAIATGNYLNDVWQSLNYGATFTQQDSGSAGFLKRMGHCVVMQTGGY